MLLALTQLIIKPYKYRNLNIFDGIILQIMIFASMISLFDSFSTAVLSAFIILLVTLPLVAFAVMMMVLHKNNIKKILTYFKLKPIATNDNLEALPISDIGLVIDDSMRQNATIIDSKYNM